MRVIGHMTWKYIDFFLQRSYLLWREARGLTGATAVDFKQRVQEKQEDVEKCDLLKTLSAHTVISPLHST